MGTAKSNSVHNLDTKFFSNDSGEFPAIVMGLNVFDLENVDAFLDHVVQEFKIQRTCSPPNTATMTITIVGHMSAEHFSSLWKRRAAVDPVLKHFMSTMVLADVLLISGNDLLERASLIP